MGASFMRLLSWLVAVLAVSASVCAAFPQPVGYVNDFAHVLSPAQASAMESLLAEVERNSTVEIAVVTVPSLDGMAIEQYSIGLAEQWKVGQKGKDNGILLLLAPNEREVRIEVGYGLEGTLPDLAATRIIDREMVPYLRKNDWHGGLDAGVRAVARVVSDPSQAEAYSGSDEEDALGLGFGLFFISVFFWIIWAVGGASTPVKTFATGLWLFGMGQYGYSLWTGSIESQAIAVFLGFGSCVLLAILSPNTRHSGGGYSGGRWSGGGFGGGGFSGGGFSGGFGGGSFGGGGGSGRF